jgi:hypothetical protein
MIYRFWTVHYLLVKGIYIKRRELTNSSAYALAIFCAVSPILFIISVTVDKDVFWSVFGRNIPFGPILKWVSILLLSVCAFLSPKKLTSNRIRQIRLALTFSRKLNRYVSFIYIAIFVAIFIISMIIPTINI